MKRLDTRAKVNGTARFGLDAQVPGMKYASLERCPVFGGKVKSFKAEKAKAVRGVEAVFDISNGVAVVADNTWSAMQGRKALEIVWDEGPVASLEHARESAACSRIWRGSRAQPWRRRRGTPMRRWLHRRRNSKRFMRRRSFRTLRWSR